MGVSYRARKSGDGCSPATNPAERWLPASRQNIQPMSVLFAAFFLLFTSKNTPANFGIYLLFICDKSPNDTNVLVSLEHMVLVVCVAYMDREQVADRLDLIEPVLHPEGLRRCCRNTSWLRLTSVFPPTHVRHINDKYRACNLVRTSLARSSKPKFARTTCKRAFTWQ